MIDILFWVLEIVLSFIPSLMIMTGEIVLAFCSLDYHPPRLNKNVSEEYDSLVPIKSLSFWVGIMFWVGLGIYLNFYLSGN